MIDDAHTQTRGVLRTAPDGAFELRHHAPTAALAPFVTLVWSVRWDRRGLPPYRQSTLPHPAVHLSVEDGEAWLYGPPRRRFERTLSETGRVVGVRFRPGGARSLLAGPVSGLTDRRLPAREAIGGLDADAFVAAVKAAGDDGAATVRAVQDALVPLLPPQPDPSAELAERAVDLLEHEPSLRRAADLAVRLSLSISSLHRLFAEHVGVGPGWVARRFRLQEAAARAASGTRIDWPRLAAELGYCDQAHLVRDFTRTVGESPTRYAARSVTG